MPVKILVHDLNAPVEKIFPFFSDMDKFVGVHPVIYKCTCLGGNEYRLFERLSLAFFKISFSYLVTLEKSVINQQVVMYSKIRRGATLRLTFDFTEAKNTTRITETVDFDGPPGISTLFIKFLTRMHNNLIENLGAALVN